MNYKRNEPIYFQKEEKDFHSTPNATFVRDLGLVNLDPVCEIEREGTLWIVRYSEIKSQKEWLKHLKFEWTAKINRAVDSIPGDKKTKAAIAAKLRISTATLRKRMKFLEEGK